MVLFDRRRESPPIASAQLVHATGLRSIGAGHAGAFALGALAVGALAVGSLAIGRLAIGRLVLKRGTIKRLAIEELDVDRLTVRELVVERGSGLSEIAGASPPSLASAPAAPGLATAGAEDHAEPNPANLDPSAGETAVTR